MADARRRTRIKICGLTRRDDALAAADLGADALGFVFAPKSRRRADEETVARMVEEVPPFVTLVGVFQDQPADKVRATMRDCRLHVAQLHGQEDSGYVRDLGLPALKALCLSSQEDLSLILRYPHLPAFLLDSAAGGSGQVFDWAWAREAAHRVRVVLAGGLHAGNVGEAVRAARPWAVDACSGTESSPGVKDPAKVREFIREVRVADGCVEEIGSPQRTTDH